MCNNFEIKQVFIVYVNVFAQYIKVETVMSRRVLIAK